MVRGRRPLGREGRVSLVRRVWAGTWCLARGACTSGSHRAAGQLADALQQSFGARTCWVSCFRRSPGVVHDAAQVAIVPLRNWQWLVQQGPGACELPSTALEDTLDEPYCIQHSRVIMKTLTCLKCLTFPPAHAPWTARAFHRNSQI